MAATTQQIIDALNDAILAKIQGNVVQSYTVNGKDIKYMSLKDLREFRKELMAEIAQAKGEGNVNYADFTDTR